MYFESQFPWQAGTLPYSASVIDARTDRTDASRASAANFGFHVLLS